MHIRYNIKLIRSLSGKKQDDFVRLFQGVTVAMQKSYEGGKARPDVAYMDRLARYAGVSVRRLMDNQLTATDVKLNEEEVEKVEPAKSAGFTADQLFAMFLEVSKAQTAILHDIKNGMARADSQDRIETNSIETLAGVLSLSKRQKQAIAEFRKDLGELRSQSSQPRGSGRKSRESDGAGEKRGKT